MSLLDSLTNDSRFTTDREVMCGESIILGAQEYLCHVKKGEHKSDQLTKIISHAGFASYEDAISNQRPAVWSHYEKEKDSD